MDQRKIIKKYDKIMKFNLDILDFVNDQKKFTEKEIELYYMYKEVYDEIYKECVKKDIVTDRRFKKEYPLIRFNLFSFIKDYIDQIIICYKNDSSYYYQVLTYTINNVTKQFNLSKDIEKEFRVILEDPIKYFCAKY